LVEEAPEEAGEAMNWPFSMPKVAHERVLAAIRSAEMKTSGEIRVLIERHKAPDPVATAQAYFNRLGMAKSPHRNGVLILVAPRSRSFAVIGDSGVHEKCGDAFWSELAEAMGARFRQGNFTEGLVHGIERAGDALAKSFPRSAGDSPAGAPEASEVD
jgi:uncharacterized membrane protein